ncbi:ATP-binding protein [Actimicrobium sp. CCI2.3]|uniref:ATP-binding protein n=1 Tax=Actimicrobium sp. CCI2.3 TaxID=3048616 RepID=UPI002AB4418C|nr:ATP-binding protein [Actimicrobium sp. CCI2.3]MDY7574419.1 ATP-binding protein [Actimicrobium sp. CCI2.3]MEB0022503.1 ATP-binding protein [Actimicrobium sp. CCI2.3]
MIRINWIGGRIVTRLVLVATLPVLLTGLFVILYSTYARAQEVWQELDERGHLIASLLAESSEYGVISGNVAYLERTVHWLLQVDQSIRSVTITDRDQHPLLQIVSADGVDQDARDFEAVIDREVIALPLFGDRDVADPADAQPSADVTAKQHIGNVRVLISPSVMLDRQWFRIAVGAAMTAIAVGMSMLFGLFLATGLTRPLAVTFAAVRRIRLGHYQTRVVPVAGGEIGELQMAITAMAESLQAFRQEMDAKVFARTHALQAARDEAMKSNAEKRRLIRRVHALIEEERQAMAIEMHDHFNAELIVARLEAQRILDLTSAENDHLTPSSLEEIRRHASAIIGHTLALYDMARGIVKRLRPETLDTLGLRDAIDEMVRQFDTLHPRCRFVFAATGDLSGIDSDLALTAYRLVQEALSNVVKHAQATLASVRLSSSEDGNLLCISVTDNGKGFDPATVNSGIGLVGMRERADGAGGRIEIGRATGGGTRIGIELPVRPK